MLEIVSNQQHKQAKNRLHRIKFMAIQIYFLRVKDVENEFEDKYSEYFKEQLCKLEIQMERILRRSEEHCNEIHWQSNVSGISHDKDTITTSNTIKDHKTEGNPNVKQLDKNLKVDFFCDSIYLMKAEFCNLDRLAKMLENPHEFLNVYEGIICTSKNSLKAIQKCLHSTLDSKDKLNILSSIPMFVVGKSSKNFAHKIGFSNIFGEQAGNAEKLATEVILKYNLNLSTKILNQEGISEYGYVTGEFNEVEKHSVGSERKRFLFLSGDKRRDILPQYLAEKHISFEELQVYSTFVNDEKSEDGLCLQTILNNTCSSEIWLVHFSPSLVNTFHELYSNNQVVKDREELQYEKKGSFSVHHASIGPTTTKRLEELGYSVSCTAPYPSPDSLFTSIFEFINGKHTQDCF